MKKLNKKGFTLLELLIAIAIFTSIIFICYSIFNKFLILTKDQLNINQGQLTVNDMNEYLTEDLEKAGSIALCLDGKEIAKTTQENTESKTQQDVLKENIDSLKQKLSGENNFEYSYKIKFKGESTQISKSTEYDETYDVIYTVSITKKYENSYKYTVIRTDKTDGVSITFVNDETVTKKQSEEFKVPFTIEGTNPYKVSLGYNGKNDEFVKKEFTIASIFNELGNGTGGGGNTEENPTTPTPSPDEIKPPPDKGEPPEQWGGNIQFNTLGFWTADSTIKSKDNLYTWVSSETEIIEDAYADQQDGKNDEFNIEGYVKYNNNTFTGSYVGYNEIKNDYSWQGQVKDISIGRKQIKNIAIYVSKDTILKDFKIESNEATITIDQTILRSNDSVNLGTGWHFCQIEFNNKSLLNFRFTGKLSIDKDEVSSGYAYVAYEKEDYSPTENTPGGGTDENEAETNDLDGDIIFEYISNDKYNSNMTQLTSSIKVQEKNGEYESVYNKTNDNDRNQFLRENTIHLMIENIFNMEKVNGKYIKDQTEDTSNLIRVTNSPYGNPVITNNKICKDIRDVNKILITCDDNTKLLLSNEVNENYSIIQKSSKQYELTITKKQPNINLKFTFNQINKIENFKIAFTFIEDK